MEPFYYYFGDETPTSLKFLDFLTIEDWTDRLSGNISKEYHYTLRHIAEQHRSLPQPGTTTEEDVVSWRY
jgi:hypothetical protein